MLPLRARPLFKAGVTTNFDPWEWTPVQIRYRILCPEIDRLILLAKNRNRHFSFQEWKFQSQLGNLQVQSIPFQIFGLVNKKIQSPEKTL
jgi:hypothetical protein